MLRMFFPFRRLRPSARVNLALGHPLPSFNHPLRPEPAPAQLARADEESGVCRCNAVFRSEFAACDVVHVVSGMRGG